MKGTTSLAFFLLLLVSDLSRTIQATAVSSTVVCGGSTVPYPLYSELIFGFELLYSVYDLEYLQLTANTGIQLLIQSNSSLVWSGSEFPPTANQSATAGEQGRDISFFPTALVPIIPYANYKSLGISSLHLTPRTLSLIWLGNITRWNDPDIVATNRALSTVDEEIVLVVQRAQSGTIQIFSQAIANFLEPGEWPYNISNHWPAELIANWGDRVLYVDVGNPQAYAGVFMTPYSFGFVTQGLLFELGVNLEAFALVENSTLLYPNAAAMKVIADATIFDPVTGLALNDPSNVSGWRISGYTYALMNINFTDLTKEECVPYRGAVAFFLWLLQSRQARQQATQAGYYLVSEEQSQDISQRLQSLVCAGERLSQLHPVDQRTETVWTAMFAIAMIGLPIPIILACLAAFTRTSSGLGSLIFTLCTMLGSVMLLASVALFYVVPDASYICILQTWLVGLGFVLLIMPIATKVLWFAVLVSLGNDFRTVTISPLQLVIPLLITVVGQIILLICWTTIDPYSSKIVPVSAQSLDGYYICQSNTNWIWFGIEIGFFAALLGLSFVVYWAAGNIKLRQLHDVSWLNFAVYNLIILMILLIPLLAGFTNPQPQQYYIVTTGLIFPALFTSLALYGPIVLPKAFKAFTSFVSNSRNTTTLSQLS